MRSSCGRGEKFAHIQSSIGMRFHGRCITQQQEQRFDSLRHLPPNALLRGWEMQLSVSEPQRKNKHNIWEGDRVNTNTVDAGQTCIWGEKNHKWICCLTGVEYSRTDLIEETQGTLSVLAWWGVDYMHREHVNRAQVLLGHTRGVYAKDRVKSSEVMTLAAYKWQNYNENIWF